MMLISAVLPYGAEDAGNFSRVSGLNRRSGVDCTGDGSMPQDDYFPAAMV